MPPNNVDVPAGLPRNFLRPCLLLLIAEQQAHGYDLLERLQRFGFGQRDPGTLYRTLRAMEQEGLVESRWDRSEVGPPRRSYRLTAEGADWLHLWAGVLGESRRILDSFLVRYEEVSDLAVETDAAGA